MHPPGIAYLNGPRLRRALVAACEHARTQQSELNRINVFPVPDGDTGTNLALTVEAIADHLRSSRERSVSVIAREAAEAAVLGARGNCGMMISHFLVGFADALQDEARITASDFGAALTRGVRTLYEALESPVEGTILTVMRDSARAAREDPTSDFVPLIERVVERARASLAHTPDLLPVLREAGVVDAGAMGWVSLLEGTLLFIRGDGTEGGVEGSSARSPEAVTAARPPSSEEAPPSVVVPYPTEKERYRWCTEALVRGSSLPDVAAVRTHLGEKGDSLIAIRSGSVLKVHIHTDEPDEVFRYLRSLGTLATHKAEDMRAQHAAVARSAVGGHVTVARRPLTVVTDSSCDLPEEVRRAHGILVTPLLLVDGETTYRDGVDLSVQEFHSMLRSRTDGLPTTSQPAPADFLATFRRAAEQGEEILGVMLGSSLSGTFAAAQAAARRFDDAPVHLFDSLGASLLTGLLTLKAAELAESGLAPSDIIDELSRIRGRSGILFTVDRFDRLIASGRVGRGRALLGRVLDLKPILAVDAEGAVEPVAKVRGSANVRAAMIDAIADRVPRTSGRIRFGVVHVAAPEVVPPVERALRERWGADTELLVAPATPVIATHLGVGAWGVAYLDEGEGERG